MLWLSVWSKVQLFPYGPADATVTLSCLDSLKSRMCSVFLVTAYPGCFGKDAVKWCSLMIFMVV